MKFLDEYVKDTKKGKGISTSADGPSFFISTGNYVINKAISGNYRGGIAQGRLALLAGASQSGKSYVAGNIVKAAQADGYGVLIVDSENALDNEFMTGLGADPTHPLYVYRGVTTINNGINMVSSFLKSYRGHGETQPFLIVIDSLDAMLTDSMLTSYTKGEGKGDQGQQAKQLKSMLGPFMHDVKDLNVAILCTKQVYAEQDPIKQKNPLTAYKITDAIQYPFTQIALLIKYLLRDDVTKNYEGIRLKVFGFKTRFTKPHQQVTVEVPYDKGMDPFSGLLDVAIALGVVTTTKGSAWYSYEGKKFQRSNFHEHQEAVLESLINSDDRRIDIIPDDAMDQIEVED
jgi:RecA/RadA recombinase